MGSMGSYCKWRTSEFTKAVNTSYAKAVGGFAGSLSGAVIGKKMCPQQVQKQMEFAL